MVHWLRILRLPMQGTWFKPWSRKTPPAGKTLSQCLATTEPARQLTSPVCPEPVLGNKRRHCGGSRHVSPGEEPRSGQQRKPSRQTDPAQPEFLLSKIFLDRGLHKDQALLYTEFPERDPSAEGPPASRQFSAAAAATGLADAPAIPRRL